MIVANIITDVGDWLDKVSGDWWFLIVILVIALLDSVIPIVPSETAVIIGGVAAGAGDQHLALVILCGVGRRVPRRQHRLSRSGTSSAGASSGTPPSATKDVASASTGRTDRSASAAGRC